MNHPTGGTGFMPDGFLAWVILWVWVAVALLYGLYRSFARAQPDAIRPSGPIDS
jgi:hypothetical protein